MYMKTLSFSEFRKRASDVFDWVEQGEEILVKRHGRVIAHITPPSRRAVPAWKSPGLKLVAKGPSLSQAVLDDRR